MFPRNILVLQNQSKSQNACFDLPIHAQCFINLHSPPPVVSCFSFFFLLTWYSRIQELMSDDQREAGRIPRTIECELVHDLVDSCVPGDVITVAGIVKVSNTEEGELYQILCINICTVFLSILENGY